MKQALKHLTKVMLLVGGAGLTMGNQSCQETQVKTRELKKVIDLGAISAQPIQLPGGGLFDFRYVANQQLSGVLMEADGFAFRYQPVVSSTGSLGLKLTDSDVVMMKAGDGGNDVVNWSKEAACMVNLPVARVYGSVNAFEMIGGGGLTIGYGVNGAYPIAGIEASLNVDVAQMDLSMAAVHPLTMNPLAAVNVNSEQTKVSFKFGIPLGPLFLGPSGYYQTPLAQVTKSGLTKAVDGIKEQMSKYEWSTRVLRNMDTHLMIVGGKNLNLEEGDQLAVYNEEYYWDGEPCNSTFRGGNAKEPVAIIELDSVSDELSRGKIISQTQENAVLGALVKVHKLKDDSTAAKSAETGSDSSSDEK